MDGIIESYIDIGLAIFMFASLCFEISKKLRIKNKKVGKKIHEKLNGFNYYNLIQMGLLVLVIIINFLVLKTDRNLMIILIAIYGFIRLTILGFKIERIYEKGILINGEFYVWDKCSSYRWLTNNNKLEVEIIIELSQTIKLGINE